MDEAAERRMAALENLTGGKPKGRGGTVSLKPVFGWPGSKLTSLKHLLEHVPYGRGYCEPFGGSGALLLARDISPFEVYNDRYSGITDFYIALKENTRELMAKLDDTITSRELWEHYHETWEGHNDRIERAARWYYMTAYSFQQLGRHWGRSLSEQGCSAGKVIKRINEFPAIAARLRNVTIENLDWRKVIQDFDSEDMVFYMDPPYVGTPSGTYSHMMTIQDHVELLDMIKNAKGTVVLSGYHDKLYDDCDFWDETVEWKISERMVPMSTNGNNKTLCDQIRTDNTEVIWIKR